mmetsp:Transcript_34936/g.103506  ORF Transcript_34936/g.103506 Transcript_34936/m.103506 type:complete len:115 (-) Transcript_34936:210-554(-)
MDPPGCAFQTPPRLRVPPITALPPAPRPPQPSLVVLTLLLTEPLLGMDANGRIATPSTVPAANVTAPAQSPLCRCPSAAKLQLAPGDGAAARVGAGTEVEAAAASTCRCVGCSR